MDATFQSHYRPSINLGFHAIEVKEYDNAPNATNTTMALKAAEESTPASTVGTVTTALISAEIKSAALL